MKSNELDNGASLHFRGRGRSSGLMRYELSSICAHIQCLSAGNIHGRTFDSSLIANPQAMLINDLLQGFMSLEMSVRYHACIHCMLSATILAGALRALPRAPHPLSLTAISTAYNGYS
jgi:hypothetical protein